MPILSIIFPQQDNVFSTSFCPIYLKVMCEIFFHIERKISIYFSFHGSWIYEDIFESHVIMGLKLFIEVMTIRLISHGK